MNETDRNDFIRFALILSDGQATTFKKNLTNIVKLVLFNCFGSSLTIGEIAKQAKESYNLEFSDAEINDVIKNCCPPIFIETRNSTDSVYYTYTIIPEEYDKLKKKSAPDFFVSIATRFATKFEDECCYSTEEIKTIVMRYIYYVFNSDSNTVLSLMNYKGEKLIRETPPEHFNEDEKTLLNMFLNWNDKEKNQFIYNAISSCYEYCMMTVKKDNSSFASIFNEKEFYLDANIVFRLAGFNNNERQEVIDSFLCKCKECGIEIKYTNFTSFEIESTLSYKVGLIKKFLNGQSPICIKAIKSLSSKYANLDFYGQYIDWTKKSGHKPSDYTVFLTHLKREVDKYLNQMKFVVFESYESRRDKTEFVRLCNDLTAFKSSRNKDTYEGSIKIDVENYLCMRRLDCEVTTNSFMDKKHYFITADHRYIDWAKEKTPGTIPTFVLPSVWYSIMLKYKGRTDDDYNAFCQFLNHRISSPEVEDELAEKKDQILAYVISIDESVEIKEDIISDINRRLTGGSPEILDVETYVEESHARITEDRVQEAISGVQKRHSAEREAFEKSATQEAQQKHDVGYEKGQEAGFSAGEESGFNKFIHAQANAKVSVNKTIRIAGYTFFIFVLIVVAVIFIISLFTGNGTASKMLKYFNENTCIISILSFLLAAMGFLASQLNKIVDVFSLDVEVVERKLRENYK